MLARSTTIWRNCFPVSFTLHCAKAGKVFWRAPIKELLKRTEEHIKGMVVHGTLFEELGFNYIGPVDGHDVLGLITTLKNMRDLKGPQFLHIMTKKVVVMNRQKKTQSPSTPCLNLIPPAVVCRKVAAVCRAIQNLWRLVVRNGSERQQADGDYSGDA